MFDVFGPVMEQGITLEAVVDFPSEEEDAENSNFEIHQQMMDLGYETHQSI